jgi:hypothetical protein
MTNTIKFHGAQASNFFVPQAVTLTKDGKTEVLTPSPHTKYYDSEDKMYHSQRSWAVINGRIYS